MWWRTRLASLHRRFKLSDDKEDVVERVYAPAPTPKLPIVFCREVFDRAVEVWLSRYIPGGMIGKTELHGAMSELYVLIDQKISK